jgi:transcriptional regulator with XRE-family HTH domain
MHEDTPFGRWLKARRRAADLTQDALGRRVGCAGETIRKIEAGAARPSRQVAELLAACFDIPAGDRATFVGWARATVAPSSAEFGGRNTATTAPLAHSAIHSPQSALALEPPEGTMDPQSAFYVVRPADALAQATITQPGVTITIKGPRQMGKSSLLYHTMQTASGAGKQVVLLDFQLFDQAALVSAEVFLRQFCAWISYELGVEDRVDATWRLPLSNIQRCTSYLKKEVLPQVEHALVLAMDEVDRVFDTPFRSDFFGMLRSWHNTRQAASVWKRLDLVLVTSTEPYQFVENLNQSPFNVGCIIDLEDFTPAQVHDLNVRHGTPLTPGEEERLMSLVGGQPYLVRRALYLVAAGQRTAPGLFTAATSEQGPFGDHLRHHLFRLQEQPELVAGLRQVLQAHTCPDERVFFRLRGAGLVRREGTAVVPRYPLYAAYFHEHLHG